MQQRRARLSDHVPKIAVGTEDEGSFKIARFMLLLAGLVVDQLRFNRPIDNGSQIVMPPFGKTLTDELGECILHLIREARTQGVELPLVVTMLKSGKRQPITVRDAYEPGYYWVDISDMSSLKPLMYSIFVKTYVHSGEASSLRTDLWR
ncbi:hypothetical protein [Paenibacillus paeoniae]|uniref:Uncharacterized protein n=1 Tax=Paenibacillus paeoniae TaxID=2292705 RepID=A0A371PKG5_9BACL|nr:hypothetical protein [Paenibacillus paeoniae]REK76633.1 hypothetical protein DX130_06235 [Paenibacillus paeoniae]